MRIQASNVKMLEALSLTVSKDPTSHLTYIEIKRQGDKFQGCSTDGHTLTVVWFKDESLIESMQDGQKIYIEQSTVSILKLQSKSNPYAELDLKHETSDVIKYPNTDQFMTPQKPVNVKDLVEYTTTVGLDGDKLAVINKIRKLLTPKRSTCLKFTINNTIAPVHIRLAGYEDALIVLMPMRV